ncbi:MAG: hypothetical protein ABEJ22_09785 [Haloferacaceae archaeon]
MTTVWSYPWSLLAAGVDRRAAKLGDCGVDGLAVASHYHSVRTLNPSAEGDPFAAYPGGCYFDPGDRFADAPIRPPVNEIEGRDDALEVITDAATGADLSVTAWLVCLHNTRLGTEHPTYRFESAFGHRHDHAFCPSHPEVRTYYGNVAGALASYDVDAIGLESIGFPSAFHGHGDRFGHEKNQAVASRAEELLLSQCFCPACRREADFDIEAARDVVRDLCKSALQTPENTVPSLEALVDRRPVLADLFAFRARVVESLVRHIDRASGDVSLTYYASDGFGRGPTDGWPAGVRLDRLSAHLDRVTALCYTGDPAVARRRVAAFGDLEGVAVDAGVSLDPEYVGSRNEWDALLDAVRDPLEGELRIYNEGLLTEEQFDWLSAATDAVG